jgi:hypothetical protein
MQTTVDRVEGQDGAFMERKCCITLEGNRFCAGGSVLAPCTDGRWRGIVYDGSKDRPWSHMGTVKTWEGKVLSYHAIYGPVWTSNFGDQRRGVWFTYEGRRFYGVLCSIGWNRLIRVREIRN